jgi:hypothetical protein
MTRINFICLLPALVFFLTPAQAAEKIFYPRPESATDSRGDYPVRLLELAISKSGAAYTPTPGALVMPQARALKELEANSGAVQIVWTMTSKEREQQLMPIRIPIYKGLIGWRLALVKEQKAKQFESVKGIKEMTSFEAGQGHDWPDTEILRANGLRVVGEASYDGLFKLLEKGRFDYFPRSMSEIWAEADTHASTGLVVDKNIALHYRAAVYYFVNKDNTKLADALRKGLERAIADGSFDKLFHQYNGDLIRRAGLSKRVILELNNPLLPMETPLNRKGLWFKPGK